MSIRRERFLSVLTPAALGVLALASAPFWGASMARAGEIIPAVGITRAVDGDDKTRTYGSLALRGSLLPILKSEIGVAYHSEERFDDRLHVRTWPVTASLWLQPVPMLYAGGGVGWYQTTFDYDQDKIPTPIKDETKSEFGVHLGGGFRIPIAPSAALDLNGRYVMLEDQTTPLIPEKFNPDFWTTSLGLSFGF